MLISYSNEFLKNSIFRKSCKVMKKFYLRFRYLSQVDFNDFASILSLKRIRSVFCRVTRAVASAITRKFDRIAFPNDVSNLAITMCCPRFVHNSPKILSLVLVPGSFSKGLNHCELANFFPARKSISTEESFMSQCEPPFIPIKPQNRYKYSSH